MRGVVTLRVDVESDPGHLHIPPGNPFVNTPNARPEIWAFGVNGQQHRLDRCGIGVPLGTTEIDPG